MRLSCAEIREIQALTAEAQRAIDLLQERRTALISAAVTGKIDVRGLAESEEALSVHKEVNFETEICEHLAANGWLYNEGDAAKYDRACALFPEDVLAWAQATQPKSWDAIVKNHGTHATETLLTRVRDQIDQRGTLDVLRHGIEMLSLERSCRWLSSSRR